MTVLKKLLLGIIFVFALMLWSFDLHSPGSFVLSPKEGGSYASIKQRGVLVAATSYNPFHYYIGSNGAQGLEYEMLKDFAKFLDVDLKIETMDHNALLEALDQGKVDVAAAGLRYSPERAKKYQMGASYLSETWQLAYMHGTARPKTLGDITESILIPDNTALIKYLTEAKKKYPQLTWKTAPLLTQEEQLLLLVKGDVKYTIASSIDISSIRQIKPKVDIAFNLGKETSLHWYFPKENSNELQALNLEFMNKAQESGEVARLEEKYLSFLNTFDYVDIKSFIAAIQNTLPKYESTFKENKGNIDWRLLAAVAYQESHWNPVAASPTGVEGIMMLTNATAERVGVKNRLNAAQSIRGGSEYLQLLLNKIPKEIHKDDRIWYALAAYNIGLGHLLDARRLTTMRGGDANNWLDLKENLPLLAEKKYYSKLKFGYARGYEAYDYVENIRRYYNALKNYLRIQKQPQGLLQSLLNRDITDIVVYKQLRGKAMTPFVYRDTVLNKANL